MRINVISSLIIGIYISFLFVTTSIAQPNCEGDFNSKVECLNEQHILLEKEEAVIERRLEIEKKKRELAGFTAKPKAAKAKPQETAKRSTETKKFVYRPPTLRSVWKVRGEWNLEFLMQSGEVYRARRDETLPDGSIVKGVRLDAALIEWNGQPYTVGVDGAQ